MKIKEQNVYTELFFNKPTEIFNILDGIEKFQGNYDDVIDLYGNKTILSYYVPLEPNIGDMGQIFNVGRYVELSGEEYEPAVEKRGIRALDLSKLVYDLTNYFGVTVLVDDEEGNIIYCDDEDWSRLSEVTYQTELQETQNKATSNTMGELEDSREYTDIMIDIETLDTKPSAIILTIGAVCFNPGYKIDKGPEFYEKIYAPEQELLHGRTRCADTEKWWLSRIDTVISEAFSGEVVLKCALYRLVNFIAENTNSEGLRIWAKSPQFDLVILRDALSHFDIAIPWHYRDERDVRTAIMHSMKAKQVDHENRHHALQDAHHQIEQLSWAFRDRNN